jgi:hypothetical protein
LQERSLYARSVGTDRDAVPKQSRRRAALVPARVFMTFRVLLRLIVLPLPVRVKRRQTRAGSNAALRVFRWHTLPEELP